MSVHGIQITFHNSHVRRTRTARLKNATRSCHSKRTLLVVNETQVQGAVDRESRRNLLGKLWTRKRSPQQEEETAYRFTEVGPRSLPPVWPHLYLRYVFETAVWLYTHTHTHASLSIRRSRVLMISTEKIEIEP